MPSAIGPSGTPGSSRPCRGSASTPMTPRSRVRTTRVTSPPSTWPLRSGCSPPVWPTTATCPATRSRRALQPRVRRATAAGRATVDSRRRPGVRCVSVCRRDRPWYTTPCAARWCSTTPPSRTSCCCVATAARCSCWRTSSTTSRCASPTSFGVRSTCPTRRSSRCCGRRSACRRRCGATCPCW